LPLVLSLGTTGKSLAPSLFAQLGILQESGAQAAPGVNVLTVQNWALNQKAGLAASEGGNPGDDVSVN